jgi:hypothetical protein
LFSIFTKEVNRVCVSTGRYLYYPNKKRAIDANGLGLFEKFQNYFLFIYKKSDNVRLKEKSQSVAPLRENCETIEVVHCFSEYKII